MLKKFATPDYQEIQNIYAFVFPFCTCDDEDDSDRCFDDERNMKDPPCPSYFWDLARFQQSERLEAEERNQAIMDWSSGITG